MTLQSRINPPGTELGRINAVMGGRGRHVVEKFAGPLSVKFMMHGTGLWRTPEKLFRVEEGHFLVLNAQQTYALHFSRDEPHESFCPFFSNGFVEDIARTMTTSAQALLDDPEASRPALEFPEHLHAGNDSVISALNRLHALARDSAAELETFEEAFRVLAYALIDCLGDGVARERARLPAVKASTRAECHRRLMHARDFMHAHAGSPLDLDRIAKEAALSSHYFHRLFKVAFGKPPHRYLVGLRLDRAARLLARTEAPITAIAAKAGFESLSSFSTRFARQFGVSPSTFRAAKTSKNGEAPSWDHRHPARIAMPLDQ